MALKNHALDDRILTAARTEFLENGYEKASLRKIAALAGVTIGAIYTRYPTKDALFCALVQPLSEQINEACRTLKGTGGDSAALSPAQLARSTQQEAQAILDLLFADYDQAVLLLCRSHGSSLERFFNAVIDRRLQEIRGFFHSANVPSPDDGVLQLLVSSQYQIYAQIIGAGCDLQTARARMHAAVIYHTGGWLTLLRMQEAQGDN